MLVKKKSEGKEQKGGFLGMLLGTLGATLLGNVLACKGINGAGEGIINGGEETIRTRQDFQCRIILKVIFK